MIKERLIATRVLENNNICLTLSLYSHKTDDEKVFFSYFTDYLGFGIEIPEDEDIDKSNQIFLGHINLTSPKKLSKTSYQEYIEKLVLAMDRLTFEEVFSLLSH